MLFLAPFVRRAERFGPGHAAGASAYETASEYKEEHRTVKNFEILAKLCIRHCNIATVATGPIAPDRELAFGLAGRAGAADGGGTATVGE